MFTYAPTRLLFILAVTAGLSSCLVESTDIGANNSGSNAVIDPTNSPPINAKRAICDPFETNSPQARDRGLFGNIFYLSHKHNDNNDHQDDDENHHKNMSSKGKDGKDDKDKNDKDDGDKNASNKDKNESHDDDDDDDDDDNKGHHHGKKSKSVEDYIKHGVLADAVIYLDRVFIQTHRFKKAFKTMAGDQLPLHDKKLYKGFAMSVESQLKLGANEQPGYYQLALIADAGALLKIIDADGSEKVIVDNDGRHSTKMACATERVYLDHNTRIPIKLQHYQEKGNLISLVAMWRPWPTDDQGPVKDFYCGKGGNGLFFKFEKTPVVPKKPFYELLARNWKVLENDNYQFKEQAVNPCVTAEAPLAITSTSAVDVSYLSGSATLSWTTNIPATSQIEVENISTGALLQSSVNATLDNNHTVTITGLAPNTLYSIKGISTTLSGQTASTDKKAFNTEEPLALTAAEIINVSYTNGSATLSWASNIAATGQVEVINIATGAVLQSSVDPALFLNHVVSVSGLLPNTFYSIKGISVTPGGQTAASAEISFKTEDTLAIGNVIVSNLLPQSGSATLSWTTNIPATGQIEVINTVTGAVLQSAVDANLTESHIISITGLAPNIIYSIRGISTTPGGQNAISVENTFNIEEVLQITGITIASVSFVDSSATLNWLTDIPATGQVELTDVLTGIVSQSALDINLSVNHNMVITGLLPGTTYNIRGVSTTPGGQIVFSDPITFRTEDILSISNFSITQTSRLTHSAKFVWNTNIPSTSQGEGRNVVTGVVNQSIFDPTLVLSHNVEVTDLLANTQYAFRGISTTPGGQIMYTNEIVVRMPR